MNKFIKYLLYAGVAFFCYLLYVSRPSYKSRPFGDIWDKSEECPYCDQTGYSSWHLFGLISEKCDKCFGLGWLTEERYKKLMNGASFGNSEEENGDDTEDDDDNTNSTGGQINPISVPSSPSTTYEDPTPTSTRRTCPYCNGTGQGNDEIIYAPNYTGEDNSTYCAECGSTGPAHSHVHHTCQTCFGKGYVE